MNTAAQEPSTTDQVMMEVLDRLSKVEEGLKTVDPAISIHCKVILNNLQKYEELSHLLKDEQIAVLIAGMKTYRQMQLVKEASTKRNSKSLKNTTLDDL